MIRRFAAADWLVAWDAAAGRHHYLRGADLVTDEDRIVHVGAPWEGEADEVVDCAGRMLLPGLVNVHAHPSSTLEAKSLIEEVATIELGSSLLYDYYKFLNLPAAYKRANLSAALAECLTGGSTTVVDVSYVPSTGTYPAVEGWIDTLAASGIRAYAGAQAASAVMWTPDGHHATYRWNVPAGEEGLRQACALVDEARAHPSRLVDGVLAAGQADTCTPELLRDMAAEARARDMTLSIHAAQAPIEFREMVDRTGLSSIRWLDEQGFLGERTILAHCLFMDDHPRIHWPPGLRRDRDVLAASGATVGHCPWIQAKNGRIMHSFAGYLRDGVRVAIGTDCAPMSMLEELRWVTTTCRIADGWRLATSVEDVFRAATVGGAAVLGRDDLGRLAPGAKADLLSIDLAHPQMVPTKDPLRSLIFYAGDRALRDVWVDGRQVVGDGEALLIDRAAALEELRPGFEAVLEGVAAAHRDGTGHEEAIPLSLEVR